jgi:uridine kinase
MAHLIVIGGGSGSGKSLLALALKKALEPSASILSYDPYDKDQGHLTPQERDQVNYDEPAVKDEALFVKHLEALKRNESIAIPQFDYQTHTRKKTTTPFVPTPLVIVEGILAYAIQNPRHYYDYFIYVDAPSDIRLARRVLRDQEERGYSCEHIIQQYLTSVRPMHERYIEPIKKKADFVFDNSGDDGLNPQEIAKLVTLLRTRFLKKD